MIHNPVTCTCDFVDPYDFNSFARKGDVFHIVDFLSEEEHTIPCEDMTMDDVPDDVYQINCVDCLKVYIGRLQLELRKAHRRIDDVSSEVGQIKPIDWPIIF